MLDLWPTCWVFKFLKLLSWKTFAACICCRDENFLILPLHFFVHTISYSILFLYSIVNRLNCQENANVKVFCTNCMSMHFSLNMRRYSKAIKGFQFQICNARSNYLMQTTTKTSSVSLFIMVSKRKSIIVDSWKGNYRNVMWMMWSD